MRQRTHDVEVKKYCISLLEKLGSFQYTREVLESLDKEARAEVINFMNLIYISINLQYLIISRSHV